MKHHPSPRSTTSSTPLRCVGRWLAVAAGLMLAASASAQVLNQLPILDSFPYTDNERLGVTNASGVGSGVIWQIGNSTGSFSPVTSNLCALSYPGLLSTNSGVFSSSTFPVSPTSNRNRGAAFNSISNDSVYVSLLLNIRTYPTNSKYFFALLNAGIGTSNPNPGQNALGFFVDQIGQLSLSKASETPTAGASTAPLALNSTYLIVLRYTFNTNGPNDDEVSLWLNPTGFGAAEGSLPAPTITTTNGGNDQTAIQSFMLVHRAGANNPGGTYFFDEVRIATNWATVTPTSGTPGTAFSVTGGGTNCNSAAFPVGLSGSDLTVDYWLMTNSVFTGTILNGTGSPLDFGVQTEEAVYSVLASNTVTSVIGFMNGFKIIDVLQPPSITAQPSTTTISSGGQGTISVVAQGDGLTYQWRKNGVDLSNGGHISGATTPNLTIYPADGSDAATALNGYDVVITGSCTPPQTSSVVAVTIKAPSSLVWQGDGITDPWDVGITADWLDGLANVVFNYGDAVTFNGLAAFNTVASLNSLFLSPASINVVNMTTFRFIGAGAIVGPSTTLSMNTSGELVMNAGNTYGGGTTINQGTVSIDNNSALGTGTITLAGGSLNVSNQVTLGNAVNVTGDSTIVINNTSTSALVLNSNVTASAGSLTFFNNTFTRGPTIRLAGPGFTFNRPIILNLGGTQTTNLFLASYNTTNDQVFNGVISGEGSFQRIAGGGTTILNAINTYTNRTDVQGGTLLVNGQITGTGPVSVSGGTLGGSGVIAGPVFMTGGTLAPGNRAIGQLTINNDLTVTNNIAIEVNRSLSVSNDLVSVSGILSNSGPGSVTVTNLGPLLKVGDRFVLFDKPVLNGSSLSITGAVGVTWANDLQTDGSITVLEVPPLLSPLITSIVPSGGDYLISGTNGTEGIQFLLLSSSSLTTPLASWTSESTNSFGPGGGFSVNAPNGGTQKFYIIKLYLP